MAIVKISVVTKSQGFSVNTEDPGFTYTVESTDAAGISLKEVDASATHSFENLADGSYRATVEKLGFSATAEFTVTTDGGGGPAEGPTFDVPDTITVDVTASPAPTARKAK